MARAVASGAIRRPLDLTKSSCAVGGSPCGTKRAAIGCAPCKRVFWRAVRSSLNGYDDTGESGGTWAAQGAIAGCGVSGHRRGWPWQSRSSQVTGGANRVKVCPESAVSGARAHRRHAFTANRRRLPLNSCD